MPALSAATGFSIAACLHQHPYFKDLSLDLLDVLARQATRRTFEANEMIAFEGELSSGMWIIERGHVKIFKISLEGREHILHLAGPGESFNDIPALDGGPNPANAAALTQVTAWMLASANLDALLNAHPQMARAVVDGLARRIRALVQQIEDLALCSVPSRLARFLLNAASDESLEQVGVTRVVIAAHLATTPETISRALRALEEAGAIRFDRHRIVIVDPHLLRDIAMM